MSPCPPAPAEKMTAEAAAAAAAAGAAAAEAGPSAGAPWPCRAGSLSAIMSASRRKSEAGGAGGTAALAGGRTYSPWNVGWSSAGTVVGQVSGSMPLDKESRAQARAAADSLSGLPAGDEEAALPASTRTCKRSAGVAGTAMFADRQSPVNVVGAIGAKRCGK